MKLNKTRYLHNTTYLFVAWESYLASQSLLGTKELHDWLNAVRERERERERNRVRGEWTKRVSGSVTGCWNKSSPKFPKFGPKGATSVSLKR